MTCFKIEDKEFFLHDNYRNETKYIIKSSPNPYSVEISLSSDILREIQNKLNENANNVLIVDKNIKELYFKDLNIDSSRIFVVQPDEEFKSLTNGVLKFIDFLAERNFTKKEEVIAIGGGITEDIAAFACACFKRGVKWIFYPTTLLSMCDSCIGGKTGINYHGAKNQIALFSAPSEVHININFLKTLSDYDIKSGMGEILKLFITGGNDLLSIYENAVENGRVKHFNNYTDLIKAALAVKRAVIEEDEFEKYYRKSLNYGHTMGHAIEVLSDYKIPHGQAVILGMLIVNKIAFNRHLLNEKDYEKTKKLSLQLLGNIKTDCLSLEKLEMLLKNDKKTEGNEINFVIISAIGNTRYLKINLDKNLLKETESILHTEF